MNNTLEVIPASGNTQLATVPMTAQVHPTTIDISVSGDDRESLAAGQATLIRWCENRLAQATAERDEAQLAFETAQKKKWGSSTLKRIALRLEKVVVYYDKMLAAFKEGYVMVPTFPLQIFAIRTGKKYPKQIVSTYSSNEFRQDSQKLEAGEGEYKNPLPPVYQRNLGKDAKGNDQMQYYPHGWNEIDFPVTMAKPHIMEAVDHAMALKIFDEIGILPSVRTKGDPLICGTLRDPRDQWGDRKVVFMIAWHVDTRTL